MPFYAIATVPLIKKLNNDNVSQVWYADDASGIGKLTDLRSWWDKISSLGPADMDTIPMHQRPGLSPRMTTMKLRLRSLRVLV